MNDTSSDIAGSKFGPELECSICSDLFFRPVSMNCGHTFCKECLLEALKVKPMCPLCRAPIFAQDMNLNENVTLRTLIENSFKDQVQKREKLSQEKQIKEIEIKRDSGQAGPRKFENFMTLRQIGALNLLFPGTEVHLKFLFIGSVELFNFVCPNKSIVCLPQKQNHKYPFVTFSAECLEFIKSENSKNVLEARVRVLERVIVEKSSEFESENPDILKNFQLQSNFKFLVSTGVYLEDDYSTLDSYQTQKIVELVQPLGLFFNRLIEELNTRSHFTFLKILQRVGRNNFRLLYFSDPTLMTSIKNIEAFSFLASGLLKCNPAKKRELFETNDLLHRLRQLKFCIDGFQHINDPLMVLDLDTPSQNLFTPLNSLFIMVGIFVILYFSQR